MSHGDENSDFESELAVMHRLLREQSAVLEVLMYHLARAEAAIGALSINVLGDKERVKKVADVKDHLHRKFYEEMASEAKENLEEQD